jgi:hypothetical protein
MISRGSLPIQLVDFVGILFHSYCGKLTKFRIFPLIGVAGSLPPS